MKKKLDAVRKVPCVVCGSVAGTRRKDWLKGSARSQDRRVFCQKCLRAEWMVEHDWQVDFDAVLGSGTFGVVYQGKLATTGMRIAVKCIDQSEEMGEEVRLQQICVHPCILRVIDSCGSGVKGYVALEYCPHGDLSDLIRDKSAVGFDLAEMVGYMVDLFSAVAHVHRCGIVHRDIKPANILCQAVDGQNYWQLRLADFGLAAVCPASGYSLLGHGTVQYMPVEQLLGFCNSACDVWAAGCILFELLTCEILVPDSASWDNSVVLEFLRGECLGAKLDEAVLCYSRKADISVGLLKLLTLDWCRRPGADESLFYFSSGASGSSGSSINVVDLPSDIGLACAPHSPPPFLPQSWLAYWASDKVAWYFARSDDLDRATWSVPPCVPKPWGVYWSRTRNAFYFKNECKLE